MKTARIASLLSFAAVVACFAAGCSSGREVEAKGEVKAPAGSSVQSVLVEFYDVPKEADGEEKKVDSLKLDQPGSFSKKVQIEGDKIRLFALADLDGDGACDEGEAWASLETTVNDDDTISPVVLELRTAACPTPAAKP